MSDLARKIKEASDAEFENVRYWERAFKTEPTRVRNFVETGETRDSVQVDITATGFTLTFDSGEDFSGNDATPHAFFGRTSINEAIVQRIIETALPDIIEEFLR